MYISQAQVFSSSLLVINQVHRANSYELQTPVSTVTISLARRLFVFEFRVLSDGSLKSKKEVYGVIGGDENTTDRSMNCSSLLKIKVKGRSRQYRCRHPLFNPPYLPKFYLENIRVVHEALSVHNYVYDNAALICRTLVSSILLC
jgi:hypothetical protein